MRKFGNTFDVHKCIYVGAPLDRPLSALPEARPSRSRSPSGSHLRQLGEGRDQQPGALLPICWLLRRPEGEGPLKGVQDDSRQSQLGGAGGSGSKGADGAGEGEKTYQLTILRRFFLSRVMVIEAVLYYSTTTTYIIIPYT